MTSRLSEFEKSNKRLLFWPTILHSTSKRTNLYHKKIIKSSNSYAHKQKSNLNSIESAKTQLIYYSTINSNKQHTTNWKTFTYHQIFIQNNTIECQYTNKINIQKPKQYRHKLDIKKHTLIQIWDTDQSCWPKRHSCGVNYNGGCWFFSMKALWIIIKRGEVNEERIAKKEKERKVRFLINNINQNI